MDAYLELGALLMQMVFLTVILSVVGVAVSRIITRHSASRQSLSKNKPLSNVDAARARAQARSRARIQANA